MTKKANTNWTLRILSASTLLSGLVAISSILLGQSHFRVSQLSYFDSRFTLIVGLTLIYLASGLRRGKHAAWLLSVLLYGFLLIRNLWHFAFFPTHSFHNVLPIVINLGVPALSLLGLVLYRRSFSGRSELLSLSIAVRRALIILLVAVIYGIFGFTLFDKHDFHQEIGTATAAHYTFDQFGVTTDHDIIAYTKRARIFLDSLSIISVGSLFYIGLSLFRPIRFRLHDQSSERYAMQSLLQTGPCSSEDFFKLWPHDKAYFFNANYTAGLAYRVVHNVALVVGDPAGHPGQFSELLASFDDYCSVNNWTPALIHVEAKHLKMYEAAGFAIQKIGEEAIIDLAKFEESVAGNKYFRHINNKFTKLGYTTEWLEPPHSDQTINRLREVSDSWLKAPGRTERTFMMGYFSPAYMNQCRIMVVRGPDGLIAGFVNQITSYVPTEANIDFLRHAGGSPGNINDFLLMNFIKSVHQAGAKTLNLGLSPLAGIEKLEGSAVNSLLKFVYANADRFYSFSGLTRFKNKYEPDWQDRYVCYRGNVPGLVRAMNALNRAMTIK